MKDLLAVSWELVPYSFITTHWGFDPDYGWLEFCLLESPVVKKTFLRRWFDATLRRSGPYLRRVGSRLRATGCRHSLENELW